MRLPESNWPFGSVLHQIEFILPQLFLCVCGEILCNLCRLIQAARHGMITLLVASEQLIPGAMQH